VALKLKCGWKAQWASCESRPDWSAKTGVLAEVDYFLRDERPPMRHFMDDLARGPLT